MQFQTLAQKNTYERIAPWMREFFGGFINPRSDVPVFEVLIGEVDAVVQLSPWGEEDSTITTRACLGLDAPLTPGLMHFLLRENDQMRFGAFGLDYDDRIFFEHTIAGSGCEKEELRGSILAVVTIASQYSQLIRSRWGIEPASESPMDQPVTRGDSASSGGGSI